MAALHSSQPRLSQERGLNEGQSTSSHQHAVARDSTPENLDPLPTSRVFEGMLKTTTETGDIGIFSLKASRISQPLSGPRRIYHPPQPLFRHFQPRDDRCHILSHPHDASSEILSTYDTTSQRSVSQYSTAQDTNRHSYSATYSSPIVSNRRPYATLANKTGENGPSSCPRSPFSSMPRAIRPARSCFPVLVDGDDTSILPNAEAEQLLYVCFPCHAVPRYRPWRGLINFAFFRNVLLKHCRHRPCIFGSRDLHYRHFVTIQADQLPPCWGRHPSHIEHAVQTLDVVIVDLLLTTGSKQISQLL